MGYHHGDLPAALLAATVEQIDEVGLPALSLRRVAAQAGVSHTAAAHHFGDKTGLLTALATEGHRLLGERLEDTGEGLFEMGLAYVDFAATRPSHFAVMFQPELHHRDDPDLVAAAARTSTLLSRAAGSADVATAAWAFVHGMATLHLTGNLETDTPAELASLTQRAARGLRSIGRD
jgi:AcrR family transcriptional regulator